MQLKIINIICLNHTLITNGVTKRQYNRQYNIEYNQRHRILEYRILPKAIYYRNVDKRNILGWKSKGILEAVKWQHYQSSKSINNTNTAKKVKPTTISVTINVMFDSTFCFWLRKKVSCHFILKFRLLLRWHTISKTASILQDGTTS